MLHTLSSRLLVTHLLVAVVALSLVGLLSSGLFRRYYVAQTQRELSAAGDDLAATLGSLMAQPDGGRQVTLVTQAAGRALGGRVCVFTAQNSDLLASSDLKPGASARLDTDALVCEAKAYARIENTQVLCHPGPVISVVAPIFRPRTGERLGVVLLRRPLREVETTLRAASYLIAASGGLAALLALVLAALASRTISRPLADMARAASDLADGNFETRVVRRGPLELRTVAASLNHMADSLARAFGELKAERERLADILATMEEGVVGLNSVGRVVVANASARRLLGVDDLEGQTLAAALPEACVGDELADLLAGRQARFECTIPRRDQSLRLHACRGGTEGGGVVVVIADVTQAERLERLRREFIANASHELRAPLTSIQGFIGAVADGTAATAAETQRCLRIAAQQADLMRRLVDQLLDLSRLQAGVVPFALEPLDLAAVARDVLEALSPQADSRRVQLRLQADSVPAVAADGDRMTQVLVNLIDNAIRFSVPDSQVRVTVALAAPPAGSAAPPGEAVVVAVRDHGPGVPEADLPYVWERFHKADKSRLRSEGGAGLGLAIAREIVLAHGGTVAACNVAGGGACFSFSLPASPTAFA